MNWRFLLFLLISFLILSCLIVACNEPCSVKEFDTVFGGTHRLQKFVTEKEHSNSAYFFLFFGEGESKDSKVVYFSWQLPDSTWAINKLNLMNIRVKTNLTCKQPLIKFYYRYPLNGNDFECYDLDGIYRNFSHISNWYITSAIIECHPDDWSLKVELPFSK